jgi:Histidine kinase
MTTAARTPSATAPVAQWAAFVWRAWRTLPRSLVAYAALIWLAWGFSMAAHMLTTIPGYEPWEPIATGFYDTFLFAALLLLGIAVADAVTPVRVPPWTPHALAGVVAGVAGSFLLVYTEPLVGLHCCWSGARPADWVFIGISLLTNLVICCLAALGYLHRRRALQRSAALHRAQVDGAQLCRKAFAARLQAMQARVEPQFLFNTLANVERLYDTDAKLADRVLDDLIVYLRTALPQLRETTSTVAREIELAQAYLNVVQAGPAQQLSLDIALLSRGGDLRFPPMILLPLIEYSIAQRTDPSNPRNAIAIAIRADSHTLFLTLTDAAARAADGAASAPALHDVRERLAALYGGEGRLRVETSSDHALRAVIEIPHEHIDDRGHC